MLDEVITELVDKANAEQSVASVLLANGMTLLVYPMEHGFLLGAGLEAERAQTVRAADVLQKRASDMARYGFWMPARAQDGTWYLLRRMRDLSEALALQQEDLDVAGELLT